MKTQSLDVAKTAAKFSKHIASVLKTLLAPTYNALKTNRPDLLVHCHIFLYIGLQSHPQLIKSSNSFVVYAAPATFIIGFQKEVCQFARLLISSPLLLHHLLLLSPRD